MDRYLYVKTFRKERSHLPPANAHRVVALYLRKQISRFAIVYRKDDRLTRRRDKVLVRMDTLQSVDKRLRQTLIEMICAPMQRHAPFARSRLIRLRGVALEDRT